MSRWFRSVLCGLVLASPLQAANPPPTQVFYVPFPEDNQLTGFLAITAGNGTTQASDPMAVFVTFSAATDNTVIYYDHWEDGYERDITNPRQSTTLVFGDGNPANGYPPGNASDLIPAGTVFSLRNYVSSGSLQSVLDYDARDKVASYKPISLTKTCFPASTNTLLGGCVEVFEKGLWGTEYRVPVGTDMPTSTASSPLTFDYDIFNYTALSIMAGSNGATVQIDADNNGIFETTTTLAEGETTYVTNVLTGGRVVSDNPVQVVMFTGRPTSRYQSRDTSLLPTYRWSSSYYAPVSTSATYGSAVFLYNPGISDISVSYDYRNSASSYVTASVTVPAGGNARVNLSSSNGTNNFGAYHFYTTGTNPPVFYAFCAIDANSTTLTNNQAYDGGFTLVGRPSLTTQVLVSLGIGRDPYSTESPTQNGNPVWVTTAGNGHTPEPVYIDYNGDNAGPEVDPNGNRCDIIVSLRELQQLKIFDPDGDQSGLLVYTLNPAVKVAAAWGQDPDLATAAQPGLDVSTLLPPLREGEAGKKSNLAIDADGDGEVSAGDTLEYDIRAANSARASIPGPFAVQDNLPANLNYVPGSTRYRFSVDGSWQAWASVPDNVTGTPFPLDDAGYSIPGTLGKGQQIQVTFNATIKNYEDLAGAKVVNTGMVEISPYGLVLPIDWTDVIYGSIGDRVWSDLNGDGIQDSGEPGIAGIDVFADLNNNGMWDADEPKDVTDSNGEYLLSGLVAGTYTVRVDIDDISAINVGYGPTDDLDGLATLNSASVTLLGAQDRVDADFGYRIGASVGDRVWMDLDGDGVQDSGEPGVGGVRVYLDLDNDNVFDLGEPNALSSGSGIYYIGNLSAGTYAVRVDTTTLPAGANQIFDLNGGLDHEAAVTLLASEHKPDLDFGYRGNLSIGDLVWDDSDANGSRVTYNIISGRIDIFVDNAVNGSDDGTLYGYQIINGRIDLGGNGSIGTDDIGTFQGITVINGNLDVDGNGSINASDALTAGVANEAGIGGVRVYLDLNGNGVFDSNDLSAITNARGIYSFSNLFNITYSVRVDPSTLPSSYVQTFDLTSPSDDHAATVPLSGSNRFDVDFGYRNDASLGDLIWNDRNANGVRDPGEPGIEGVIVYIDADNDNIFDQGLERFDITDVNGFYTIDNLAAGTYAVRVEFSTLPQGSTQTYDLDSTLDHETSRTLAASENAINVDFGYRASASFGNYVWNDADADGVQNGGETGIQNVRVYLDTNGNGTFESATEPSALTDSSGAYTIGNLLPGTYTARIDQSTLPSGSVQTFDLVGGLDHSATFSLSASQARTDIDFGYTQQVLIGNYVWNDTDADGQQDGGESGIDDVTVTLFNAANDTIVGTTLTAGGGSYQFSVMPGTYYVTFDTPAGFLPTIADQGTDTADSDPSVSTGKTSNVTITGGQSNLTIDAGFYQPATIGDYVWNDANTNGLQDGAETGLDGVSVTLFRPGFGADGISGNSDDALAVATTTTADGGAYSFANLRPGTYQVQFGTFGGYSRTIADQGTDTIDSDADPGSGLTANIVLAPGENRVTTDAGYFQPVSIGDYVWNDANANGQQDGGESGLNGVTVTLYRPNFGADGISGNADDALAVATTTTAGGGAYSFANLRPGTYQVHFGTLAGYNRTFSDQGVDGTDSDADPVSGQTADITLPAGTSNTSVDVGYYQPASIGDFVWNDSNANGQQNGGEAGLNGVTVTLYRYGFGADGIAGNADDPLAVATTTTAGGGAYSFANLRPGTYQLNFGSLSGYNRTLANLGADATDSDADDTTGQTADIVLAPGANNITTDAGYYRPASIGDFVWNDVNANGQQDGGESGLLGVTVSIFRPNFGADGIGGNSDDALAVATTTTSAAGAYSFTNLRPGTYQLNFGNLSGYSRTLANAGADATDSDADPSTGQTANITLAAGVSRVTTDAGYYQPASIGDYVWNDANANGQQDGGESGIDGVVVTVYRPGFGADGISGTSDDSLPVASTTTSGGGSYAFTGLMPGNYEVEFTTPVGFSSTLADQGPDGSDSDANPANGRTAAFPLAAGGSNTSIDAGFYLPGIVFGHLYIDTNGNGTQDPGEPDLANVDVIITDVNGNVQTVSTNTSGNWTATVPPGSTTADVDGSDPQYPVGYTQTEGTDPNSVTAVSGSSVNAGNDGYFLPGSITGSVFADTDNDNDGDAPLGGVTLTLVDSAGDPIDSDPMTSGIQARTTSTLPDGSYAFINLPPGVYGVRETQPSGYNSVTDKDGGDLDEIRPITVIAGVANTGNDFIEEQPGSISGTVFADDDNDGDGDTPLEDVVLRLLDSSGNPVLDGLGQPITTLSLTNGTYVFGNLDPGDYRVVQDQPADYNSVSDTDGPNDNVIGNVTPITVSANTNSGGNDFIEIKLGIISGYVRSDDDNNGTGDSGIQGVVLNLLDGSGNPVLDGLGAPIQTTTNASGFYEFTQVPVGNYRVSQVQPADFASVSDVDGANNNVIGDETPIVMTPGLVVSGRNFVELEYGSIAGSVLADTDDNGTGDAALDNVTLTLLDGSGNPVDSDPNTPDIQPVTTTTDSLGAYVFDNLLPGNYQVLETQPSGYGSVSDIDGGNLNLIGNISPIVVGPGDEITGRNFVEVELCNISGYVFAGSNPLGGVTLTLLDENGDPVDGDPNTPGVQPITTVTSGSGFYSFTGVLPGTYQIGQTQPFGYDSFGDRDGGDINIIGDVAPITLLPGEDSIDNNFVETLDTCPDDWAHWKFLHPSETPSGNPDLDAYDNFAEFAFAMPYDNGTGNTWLGSTAWIIRPSTIAPGTLEGVFVRPKGAPLNTVYTLEYAANAGNPTVWQSVAITSLVSSATDNGDCTETIVIPDLEGLTGLNGGKGFVRIRADLDDDGGNDEVDHSSFTETEGWTETPFEICCRTYNNPYLRETGFTGTISAVNGNELVLATSAGSANLGSLLASGTYYLEVISGDHEGDRFDIASGSGNTLTVSTKPGFQLAIPPYNTLLGAPPASLVGDTIRIHRHWTLGEIFPPSSFGATNDRNTADQVQMFADGAWTIFWLYNDGILPPRWVKLGDGDYADQANAIIAPGMGMFFNNRTAATSLLAYGEVREHDFVRPLTAGNNLVSGGYPIDQSLVGPGGREMNLASGFFGSRDFATADSIFLWKADSVIGAPGYDTYYYLDNAPRIPHVLRWVKVGDANLVSRDEEVLLLGNRSVFVRSSDGASVYRIPLPWAP